MGPLHGVKVIEMGSLGPGPFAGMILADLGADVILVERSAGNAKARIADCHRRGKRSIALNLKKEEDLRVFHRLVKQADVLFEGYRPGVMERLGAGPEVCQQINPRLIYGRMTGWGQSGPLAHAAGHDINYISLTGALHAIGIKEKPIPPLNLIGDYGGGGLFLVVGILAALHEVKSSGKGQVIDAAMTDGSALLMSIIHSLDGLGMWNTQRASNMLDSGTHYYNTYETKDGKYISIGSIEPQFYHLLLEKAQLDNAEWSHQHDRKSWPEYKTKLEELFKQKSREEWCQLMEGTDICFAPVLDYKEAPKHPHNLERGTYFELDGITQPSPAPRFNRTPCEVKSGSPIAGEHQEEVFSDWEIGIDQ